MKALKIIILLLLSLVVVVYGMAFMVYRGVNNTLLNQGYYQTVVSDYDIPSLVHGELGKMIPDIVRDGLTGGAEITDPVQKAGVEAQVELIGGAIIDALDESWIETQAVMVTDDVVNSLTGETGKLSAVIDMEMKLGEIEENIAKGLQQYSDAELMAMFGAPKAYIPVIAEQIVDQLGLPESLVIADLVNDLAPGTIEMVRGYLSLMGTWLGVLVLIIILLVFLVLAILLLQRSTGMQWAGITIALSGVLFLIVKSMYSSLEKIGGLAGIDFGSLPVPSDTIEGIVKFTFSQMNKSAIVLIIVGVVLFGVGLVMPKKQQDNEV
ncbi:MAG: hypothetical protein AB7D92_01635 [Sphaerochaeta sp.]